MWQTSFDQKSSQRSSMLPVKYASLQGALQSIFARLCTVQCFEKYPHLFSAEIMDFARSCVALTSELTGVLNFAV